MNNLHNIKIIKKVKFRETRFANLRSRIQLCRSNCATNALYMHRFMALYIAREARNRSRDDIPAPRIPRVPTAESIYNRYLAYSAFSRRYVAERHRSRMHNSSSSSTYRVLLSSV